MMVHTANGNDIVIPKRLLALGGLVVTLLVAGATGGVKAFALQSRVTRTDSVVTALLRLRDAEAAELRAVADEVVRIRLDMQAWQKLECYKTRDIPQRDVRERAFERLTFSHIDCVALIGGDMPIRR
jgi:hypothetical protein